MKPNDKSFDIRNAEDRAKVDPQDAIDFTCDVIIRLAKKGVPAGIPYGSE